MKCFFILFLDHSHHIPMGFLFSLTWLSVPMWTSYPFCNNSVFLVTWLCCQLHVVCLFHPHFSVSSCLHNYVFLCLFYLQAWGGLACTSAHLPLCHTKPVLLQLLVLLIFLLCCVFPEGHPAVWPCHMGLKTKHGLPLSGCTRFTLLCMGCFPCIPARLH